MSSHKLLEELGLLAIDQFKYEKDLGGGSATSCIYSNEQDKIVFKFLIAPRNAIEIERFKLEYSVLDKNFANWNEDCSKEIRNGLIKRTSFFAGPKESYPLPEIRYPLTSFLNGSVYYFGYKYEDGTLLSKLDTTNFSYRDKVRLLHRLASALSYFNHTGYSHRDLHPDNIILLPNPIIPSWGMNNPKVKILDMGNCQKIEEHFRVMSSPKIVRNLNETLVLEDNNKRLLSSFTSMPPDFLSEGGSTHNYDSWAFGVYAYTLLCGGLPFKLTSIQDVITLSHSRQFDEQFVPEFQSLPLGLQLILKHLLSPVGKERPTIDAIVRLFLWLVEEDYRFNDEKFIKAVIHKGGDDPTDWHPGEGYF
ncbi:protein kinase domain-containing protein [Vibrio lentus]|uniref:protein kinase domain-containing protein n=1 Tax=Vibrio lentus TaxID=136468 RepID=UPI0010BD3384|nr:protein kinase [Vibrio lentus]TKF41411.1 hypothetical protein FCV64_18345 [Vibrio lentus]